ncbi:MAG: Hsp20/alpha crystallin family protein [Xenococcaceae cyanobacterium MO_207.B15]|nr:Hsp20/alpha crystallin family protein [Xenococcaceae cyanobacterium MO_207.B15]MDJ0746989.1 Hsp20/alpha crystallin family protein [Xenococcaceae cyanobacterium MO_167.B27]
MNEHSKNWSPAIELNQTNRNLILKAEVPGVDIKHLNIHAESESISICGSHDQHKSIAEQEVIPSQLHYGQLECNVRLPVKIQVEKVRAELIDGILTITMPKMKQASKVRC